MPHGQRDWSNRKSTGQTYALSDMAELAARLGSPLAYYRSGDTVFIETFGGGMTTWASTVTGAGSSLELTLSTALSPPYSLHPVVGAAASTIVKVIHYNAPITTGKIGFYTAFSLGTYLDYITWFIEDWDGTYHRTYMAWYNPGSGILSYRDENGAWTAFDTHGTIKADSRVFHHVKLVIDQDEHRYDKLYLDDVLYDMSALLPYAQADAALPYLGIAIQIGGDDTHEGEAWFDNFVLSQHEP